MAHVIGIDLGTTNSLCAVFRGGQPVLIPNAHGDVLTPSVIGLPEAADGADVQVLVGEPARDLRVVRSSATAAVFKRLMGTSRTADVAGQTFTAPELSALVLRSLKDDAETFLGEPVDEAVITVPAYFNDMQRNATKRAGEIAGLKVRRIVNEPTAAALAYGFHDPDAEKHLLVLDLGGGTFDVTLMEVFEGSLEIVATAGESFLGGEDFTDRICSWALERLGLQLESLELFEPQRLARLRHEAEAAKRALTEGSVATVRVPDEDARIEPDALGLQITREEFEGLCESLIDRIERPLRKVLRDARVEAADIDDVILVGGATRMPLLADVARRRFPGTEPLSTHDPDHVVALGAAIQAALLAEDEAVADMVMTDVCPFTLGVGITKQFGRQLVEGYYMPVLHRNTTIPVSREESVYTLEANQDVVRVDVYQGEARRVDDNLYLGRLLVKGIPHGPAGQQVRLRFTYDLNGILEVEAVVDETGRRFRTVLTHDVKGLDAGQVDAAVERLQALKFYPRDDQRTQRLLRFAERVTGEVSKWDRDGLEESIDFYETSLDAGDRTIFESAKNGLLQALSRLGYVFDADAGGGDSGASGEADASD